MRPSAKENVFACHIPLLAKLRYNAQSPYIFRQKTVHLHFTSARQNEP